MGQLDAMDREAAREERGWPDRLYELYQGPLKYDDWYEHEYVPDLRVRQQARLGPELDAGRAQARGTV